MSGSMIVNARRALARGFVLLLALLLTGIGAALPPPASAMQANGNTYVSKMTGATIAWDAPWQFDEKDSEASSDGEVVFLTSSGALVLIGYLPVGIDMNQARDQVLASFQKEAESFKPLDRGSYPNVSYSLDLLGIKTDSGDVVEFGVFTLFTGDTGQGATEIAIFMAPVQLFTDEMTDAESKITIGGTPVFQGVKPGGLQDLLNKNAGQSGGSSTANQSSGQSGALAGGTKAGTTEAETPVTRKTPRRSPTPTPPAAGETSDGLSTDISLTGSTSGTKSEKPAKQTESTANTQEVQPTPSSGTSGTASTASYGDETSDAQLAALGVTGPGQYTSPQFGVPITWTDAWTISQDKQSNPVVTSDPSQGVDGLMLEAKSGAGFVFFSLIAAGNATPKDYEAYWNSDTYFQKNKMTNAEVVDSTSSNTDATVVIRYGDPGDIVVQVMHARLSSDGSALIIAQGITSLTSDALPAFLIGLAQGVTVDGSPLMSVVEATKYVSDLATSP